MQGNAVYTRTLYRKDSFTICQYRILEITDNTNNEHGIKENDVFSFASNAPAKTSAGFIYAFDGKISLYYNKNNGFTTFNFTGKLEENTKLPGFEEAFLQETDFIGDKTTEKVLVFLKKHELELFDVIKNNKEILQEVLSKKQYDALLEHYKIIFVNKEVYEFLDSFKISYKVITKALNKHEDTCKKLGLDISLMDKIKKNPYELISMPSISFELCERIAKKLNFDMDSSLRYEAAVLEVISQYQNGGKLFKFQETGNTCIDYYLLSEKLVTLLGQFVPRLGSDRLNEFLDGMQHKGLIRARNFVKEDGTKTLMVYSRFMFLAETGIAYLLKRCLNKELGVQQETNEEAITNMAKSLGIIPNEYQTRAVKNMLEQPVSIVCGGAGTGKSTIINLYKKLSPNETMLFLAPTGKAAKRVNEVTGQEAMTIHRYLYTISDSNQAAKYDTVIIDEMSMVDVGLFYRLLLRLERLNAKLILIGDTKQLSSISAGQLLHELIASEIIPTTVLDVTFRQKNGGSIIHNATIIRKQEDKDIVFDNTFFHIPYSGENAQEQIASFYSCCEKQAGNNMCLLSPYRQKSETGTDALNDVIRDVVNPSKSTLSFRIGDKVMYRANKNGFVNGDIGTIVELNKTEMLIKFETGELLTLPSSEYDDVVLAYAMSIHKSQGSEYDLVILVMDNSHSIMHNANLLYTAITRAKKKLVIIGDKEAFLKGIKRTEVVNRCSNLALMLKHDGVFV